MDEKLWRRHVAALDAWLAAAPTDGALVARMRERRERAAVQVQRITASPFLESLRGTLGVEPSLYA